MWTYLADGELATLPVGLVTGKIELVAFDEPVIYRNFIEGAGTRAIGIGYPEKLNSAFDANELRLALLWHGAFIDAAKHWSARGAGFEGPLGDKVLRLPTGPPFAILTDRDAAWPQERSKDLSVQFRGYRLNSSRQPTLMYSWNGLNIEDHLAPTGEQDLYAMQRTLKLTAGPPMPGVWFRIIRASKIEEAGLGAYKIDDRWVLKVKAAGQAVRREQAGEWELLAPIALDGSKAEIQITYDW
jgi:hypothetical protein